MKFQPKADQPLAEVIKMKVISLDKNQLDIFVASHGDDFLQSWEWGEFNARLGTKVWRLGVEDNGELVATAVMLKKSLPLGRSYWYCPRGPLLRQGFGGQAIFEFLILELEKMAKKEKVVFFRFEPTFDINYLMTSPHQPLPDPPLTKGRENKETRGREKLRFEQTISVQPKQTIILDLAKSEEELLGAMHPKTRYNIKLAGKKNLVVKHDRPSDKEFAKFWELMEATKKRDQFSLHDKNYYRAMLTSPLMELWQVYFEEKLLAVAIVAKFGDTATYVHGASSNDLRPLMAPYWLHRQIIQEAKQEGLKHYDLFGVDKVKWPGVTRFKEGWGGANISYPGTFDFVFNSLYYRIYQGLRRMRRLV